MCVCEPTDRELTPTQTTHKTILCCNKQTLFIIFFPIIPLVENVESIFQFHFLFILYSTFQPTTTSFVLTMAFLVVSYYGTVFFLFCFLPEYHFIMKYLLATYLICRLLLHLNNLVSA